MTFYRYYLALLQAVGLGTKMTGWKILTPSQSRQSPQWIAMAPGFKILEHFNALWLYCELSFMFSGTTLWVLWHFFAARQRDLRRVLHMKFKWLSRCEQKPVSKSSWAQRVVCQCLTPANSLLKNWDPPVLLKVLKHMYTHYISKNSKFLADCFYGLNNNNLWVFSTFYWAILYLLEPERSFHWF